MAGDGEGLGKEVGKVFLGQGQKGLGIGLDRYDHGANETACLKILTSLDRRSYWLGQLRPRYRNR